MEDKFHDLYILLQLKSLLRSEIALVKDSLMQIYGVQSSVVPFGPMSILTDVPEEKQADLQLAKDLLAFYDKMFCEVNKELSCLRGN